MASFGLAERLPKVPALWRTCMRPSLGCILARQAADLRRAALREGAGLTAAVLGKGLDKEQADERTSNWEAWPLSAAQQRYAALDALASLLLYQVC